MEPKYVEMGARATMRYEALIQQLMQAKQAQNFKKPYSPFKIKIKPNELKPE